MFKNVRENSEVIRFEPSLNEGLSDEEVLTRKKENKTNKTKRVKGRSHLYIFFSSFFTFFNIILYCLAFIFLMFQIFYPSGIKYIPLTKYGFLIVILFNALTSIISQEISKRTVEKMRLISDPKASVIRNGKEFKIDIHEIVLDDVVLVRSGNEIPCDLLIKDGSVLVNESMLTGESKPLLKKVGDELLSGSFIVSGNAITIANKVGEDTFTAKLESKISLIKKKKSILMVNIYKIIKYLLIFLFPATLIVALKTYYVGVDGVHWVFSLDVITKSASTLVGMIPIGMILLSSITLSEAIVKLFKKKTMVQELYAIENLSRVTTLCLDKTGTLTTQKFIVEKVISYDDSLDLNNIMRIYLGVEKNGNATSLSLKRFFGETTDVKFLSYEPFDSSKKCSRLILNENETYSLGAPDFILDKSYKIFNDALNYSKEGYRVLSFTKNNVGIALFLLKDELRNGIKDTLNYFDNLNVNIKIISGDNISTVQEVCKQAGVKNYGKAISLDGYQNDQIKEIANEYTIFARTSPDQKQEIIKTLEEKGNVVGYIGDGVNDTLSLRQADCSIALKSGADSTKAVSDVVLLDDDFSHLPDVLKEGRRVVSNIKRSLLLFLTKVIFIGIFSIFSVFLINGLPIEIESIYIYEFISVALCGFLLSIENNKVKADKSDFVSSVLTKAFVFGIFMFISACIPLLMDAFYDVNYLSALITINITISGLVILLVICRPFNKYTLAVFIVGVVLSIFALLAFPNVFLDSSYLKGANNFAEQLKLIKNAFFNFKYFYGMSYKEYLIPVIYIFISYPLYLLINFTFNKFVPVMVKAKEKMVTKLHK